MGNAEQGLTRACCTEEVVAALPEMTFGEIQAAIRKAADLSMGDGIDPKAERECEELISFDVVAAALSDGVSFDGLTEDTADEGAHRTPEAFPSRVRGAFEADGDGSDVESDMLASCNGGWISTTTPTSTTCGVLAVPSSAKLRSHSSSWSIESEQKRPWLQQRSMSRFTPSTKGPPPKAAAAKAAAAARPASAEFQGFVEVGSLDDAALPSPVSLTADPWTPHQALVAVSVPLAAHP